MGGMHSPKLLQYYPAFTRLALFTVKQNIQIQLQSSYIGQWLKACLIYDRQYHAQV